MVSVLKSACKILPVLLSLGFSLAHRFLLDQANDDYKNSNPVNYEAVNNPNGEEVGVGHGTGSSNGSGSGSGSFTGYGPGVGTGKGYETNGHRSGVGKGIGNWRSRHGSGSGVGVGVGVGSGPGDLGHGFGKGVGYGSGSGCAPGRVPCVTPIPRIPSPLIPINPTPQPPLPLQPGCPPNPFPGYCDPCVNNASGNCQPKRYHGGSATGAAEVNQEANNIVSEPNPPDLDHGQP